MFEQEHIALAQRYYAEVVNGGDLTKVDELFSPAYITHHNDPASLPHGPEGVRQFVAMTRAAFLDFQLTVRDLFAQDDKVAARWTMAGTHTGSFFGLPATNRQVAWDGVVIMRMVGGGLLKTGTTSIS